MIFYSLAILLLLPQFIHVAFGTSSLALGLIISSLLLIFIHRQSLKKLELSKRFIKYSLVFWTLLFLSALYSYFSYGLTKPLFSLVLFIPFVASLGLAKTLSLSSFKEMYSSLEKMILLLLFLGLIGLFYTPDYFGYKLCEKPVFPFSEESHYALTLGFLALGYAFVFIY